MNTHGNPSDSRAQSMSRGLVPGVVATKHPPFKNPAQMSPVPPPAILVELVERFQVCWEMLPEFSLLGTEKRRIGFALELYGNHQSSDEHPAETCIHCHNVFGSLQVIADWAFPRERRALMDQAEVQFPCQIYSLPREKPVGVRFGIRVLHRGISDEVDEEWIEQWSGEMEWRLRQLGVVRRIASIGRSES